MVALSVCVCVSFLSTKVLQSPGCFDSGLQVICIVGSGVSHLPLVLWLPSHHPSGCCTLVVVEKRPSHDCKSALGVQQYTIKRYISVSFIHSFLLTIAHRFSMGFRSGEFAGQSSTVTPWSLNQLLVPLAVWAGAKSCWKIKSASP